MEGRWQSRFHVEVVAQTLHCALSVPSWDEWERITCPALVVRAGRGMVEPAAVAQMAERLPAAKVVEVPGAAHDVHLHRPDEWREALTAFLHSLG